MNDIKIYGKRIYLRELNENDASNEYCKWMNDSEVNKFLKTKEITIEEIIQNIKEKKKK